MSPRDCPPIRVGRRTRPSGTRPDGRRRTPPTSGCSRRHVSCHSPVNCRLQKTCPRSTWSVRARHRHSSTSSAVRSRLTRTRVSKPCRRCYEPWNAPGPHHGVRPSVRYPSAPRLTRRGSDGPSVTTTRSSASWGRAPSAASGVPAISRWSVRSH